MELTVRMNENTLVSRAAAAGSMVLLKNVRGTLPLTKTVNDEPLRVAVFGIGQLRTAFAAGVTPWRTVNVLSGLEALEEVKLDGLLSHKYRNFALANAYGELPVATLSMEELTQENDAAIVVISRQYDRYELSLTGEEEDLIQTVSGAFSRCVLVLNTPGYLDIAPFTKLVSAVLYMGIAGQEGGNALADILSGRVVPSGKLADTWPMTPAIYDRANRYNDLYVGYRYFDSFNKEVLYPFGYGLGYGKSVLGGYSIGLDGANITVEAEIENAGEVYPLREVLQVYFSAPDNVVSQPVYVLDCFAKTRLLQPGERETLKLSFPVTEMAHYDELTASYVLDPGYYDIRIGTHSRNTTIAGSVFASREISCELLRSCAEKADVGVRSRKGAAAFTYAGEDEERANAHSRAIRLSSRLLRAREVTYSKKFNGCRGGREGLRLTDVLSGQYDLRQLTASISDHDLRALVCNFGACQSKVPGALGASADLWQDYGVPPVTVCKGCDGVHVTRDIKNEEGEITARQCATAFPVPSLLACSFDRELLTAVGAAMGKELRDFGADLWLGASASLHRDPRESCYHAAFSEDPVVSGLCAAWMIQGCQKHTAAALRHIEHKVELKMPERALRELDLLAFYIAVSVGKPGGVLAPTIAVNGEALSLDNRILSDVLYDEWQYTGMAFASGELFAHFPPRPMLEQAALRTLTLILNSAAFKAANK